MLLNFALTTPSLLWLLPAVLFGLVYIYRMRGQAQRVLVASTLLLSQLKRKSNSRKIFVPNTRFWYELLVLILLLLLAAGISYISESRRVIVVIDNSLSMSQRDGSSVNFLKADSGLLLNLALEQARSHLLSYDPSQVRVFALAPSLTEITEGWSSVARAEKALEQIQIKSARDDLENSLARLIRDLATNNEQLIVFTERSFTGALDSKNSAVIIKNVLGQDKRLQNIALEDLSLSAQNLSVTVRSYAQSPSSGQLQIKELDGKSSLHKFNLAAHELKTFNISGPFSKALSVSLTGLPLELNSIELDDSAYASLERQSAKILVISSQSKEQLGLDALLDFKFEFLTPENIKPKTLQDSDAALFIFHRVTPPELPKHNSIFILPPNNDQLFKSGIVKDQKISITRYKESHPITRYLNLALLELNQATILNPPSWAETIINTDLGALLLAGELNSGRYSAIGFELFPHEGSKNPISSILLLNLLQWSLERGLAMPYEQAYSQLKLEGPSDYILDPRGQQISAIDIGQPLVRLAEPGLYQLFSASNKNSSSTIAVNYFDPSESDTLTLKGFELPKISESDYVKSDLGSSDKLTRILAILLFCILFFEFLLPILAPRIKFRLSRAKTAEAKDAT